MVKIELKEVSKEQDTKADVSRCGSEGSEVALHSARRMRLSRALAEAALVKASRSNRPDGHTCN